MTEKELLIKQLDRLTDLYDKSKLITLEMRRNLKASTCDVERLAKLRREHFDLHQQIFFES
jgi:hypothetical protein